MPSLSQRRGPGSAGESHTLSTVVSSSSRQSAASTLGETMELGGGGGGHSREGGNVGNTDDGVSVVVDTVEEEGEEEEQEEEEEVPKLKPLFAIALLLSITGIAGYTAEVLLDSIDGLTQQGGVSEEFVGLILLPLVGNSVEHVAAVTVSVKDKLDLSMAIAIGSSIQVSLCLLPILVLVGWAIGQPMSLYFDNFET
jgi:Ca2+/H+ antiporter